MRINPAAGFDWARVAWGKPDEPRAENCSYCGAAIGEDVVPLMMWSEDGYAAQFCDGCMREWWGFHDG